LKINRVSKLLIGVIAITFCGCAALLSSRQAEEAKQRQMVHVMDTAHVFITTEDIPKSKPYKVLGDLKYSEPFSTDAIDWDQIEKRLKAMALSKYPEQADAVIKANSDVEPSGDTEIVTVTGEVIQFDSSADRDMMHNMWQDLVVSPR
jgi:hypothetical protein